MGESMNHERAQQLIYAERVEGLSAADRHWLDEHLAGCADCRMAAERLGQALRGLKLAPVAAAGSVVSRTQAVVAARAIELRQQRAMFAPLRVMTAVAVLISVVSTPLAWEAVKWLAGFAQASSVTSAALFLLFWAAPAVAASLLLAGLGSHRGLWLSKARQ